VTAAEFSSPEEAEAAFYRAFEAGDLDAMMAVWADDEDIVCIHPGSDRLVGSYAVRQSWRQILGGSRLRFRIAAVETWRTGSMAVRSVYERISIEGETTQVTPIVATNVYVLTGQGWRLWMHHASAVPGADDEGDDRDDDRGDAAPDDMAPPLLH
jgi:ketosteroid isomerase-like protein